MNLPQILQTISPFLFMVIPLIVIPKIIKGLATPNATTFLIRSIVAIINMVTYFFMTNQEWFKSLIMVTSTLSLVSIFLACVIKNGFGGINTVDKICALTALISIIVWKLSNPMMANMMVQVVIVISAVPTIQGVVSGRNKEIPLPWMIASSGYALSLIALILQDSGIPSMVNLVVCIIINTSIGLIAHDKNKKRILNSNL